jgi:lysozyme
MDLSPLGRAALAAREGCRLHAYRDSVGVWTVGRGHISAAGPPAVTEGLTLTHSDQTLEPRCRPVNGPSLEIPR